MNKKKKVIICGVFIAILIVVAVVAVLLNKRVTSKDHKTFTLEVISERDNYSSSEVMESDEETLGAFLRTKDFMEWEDSEYGIYITGVYGMQQDIDNQYWWCITVDDEETSLGADSLPLEAGKKYTLTLKQGWE